MMRRREPCQKGGCKERKFKSDYIPETVLWPSGNDKCDPHLNLFFLRSWARGFTSTPSGTTHRKESSGREELIEGSFSLISIRVSFSITLILIRWGISLPSGFSVWISIGPAFSIRSSNSETSPV